MSVDVLWSRLPKVRRTGKDSWRAACPAHQGTNATALSIRDAGGGKILIKCFHGCDTLDILQSVGLDMTDLFADDVRDYKTISEAKYGEVKFYPRDLLSIIQFEARLVAMAAFSIEKGIRLSADDIKRLKTAQNRILYICEMALWKTQT